MGNARRGKRDFRALERRRFEALKLLKLGFNQSEVSRRVKVCSQTVSRWARTAAEEENGRWRRWGARAANLCWMTSSANN